MPAFGTRRPNYLGWAKMNRTPRIVASFDVLDGGHYTTDTGGIATVTSQKGRAVVGAQGTALLRPDVAAAAINGLDVMSFGEGAGDFIAVDGLQDAFTGQAGIFRRGPVYPLGYPSVLYVIDLIPSSTGSGLFVVGYLPDGRIRVQFRRFAGDTVKTIDSLLKIKLGLQQDLAVAVDLTRGVDNVLIRLDEDQEVRSSGIFTSGYGLTERARAGARAQIGRSQTSFFYGYLGRVEWGVGIATPAYLESLRLADQLVFNTPQRTLAIDPPASELARNKYYLSSGGVATVPLSGTVIRGGDDDIYARFLDITDRSPATGWETPQLLAASSGLVVSGTPAPPDGAWYPELRKDGERDADAVVDTSNIIRVGAYSWLLAGQSLMVGWITEVAGAGSALYPQSVYPTAGDDLRDARWSGHGHFYLSQSIGGNPNINEPGTNEPYDPQLEFGAGGNGGKLAANLLRAELGTPQLFVPMAVRGTYLVEHLTGGDVLANMQTQLAPAEGPGFNYNGALLAIGESDAIGGTSYADYTTMLDQYVDERRADVPGGNEVRFYLHPVAWAVFSGITTARFRDVMKATWDFIDARDTAATDGTGRVHLGWTDHDRVRIDNLHPRPIDMMHSARRWAQNVAYQQNGATHGARGPKLTSVSGVAGDSYIDGTFTLDGGTTLKGLIYNPADPYAATPSFQTTGLTGTLLQINGSPVTPTGVAITSATTVRWTFSAPLVSADTFDVGLYTEHNFDQSVMLMDDSNPQGDTIGVPAQPTRLWVSGVVA